MSMVKVFISGLDGTNQCGARWVSIASELYPKTVLLARLYGQYGGIYSNAVSTITY